MYLLYLHMWHLDRHTILFHVDGHLFSCVFFAVSECWINWKTGIETLQVGSNLKVIYCTLTALGFYDHGLFYREQHQQTEKGTVQSPLGHVCTSMVDTLI